MPRHTSLCKRPVAGEGVWHEPEDIINEYDCLSLIVQFLMINETYVH